jgi:DNA-binding transcriptional ArsR family regulator
VAVFEALADPTRRRILELLAAGERSAGDLAGEFAISRPGVSRHLRVLRESGLVRARGEGQRRLYSVDPAPLAEVQAWLTRCQQFWAQRLDALDTEVRRGRRGGSPADRQPAPAAASQSDGPAGDRPAHDEGDIE